MSSRQPPQAGTLVETLRGNSDVAKAILIILVVMDHNEWLRLAAPDLFRPLTFHVLGFFLLAFSVPEKKFNIDFLRDRFIRYMVPFWWMLTAYSLLYYLVVAKGEPAADRLLLWLSAAMTGNAPQVKASAGTLILWFLPALLSLSLLVAGFEVVKGKRAKIALTVGALVLHLFVPLLSVATWMRIPLGFGIACHVFALGLIWRVILPMKITPVRWLIMCGLFLASYGALVANSQNIEIATLDLVQPSRPFAFILQDMAGVLGFVMVIYCATVVGRVQWLVAIGQQSLLIYLIHPLLYQLAYKLAPYLKIAPQSQLTLIMVGLIAVGLVLATSYWLSRLISGNPTMARVATPRGWYEWPPTGFLMAFWKKSR